MARKIIDKIISRLLIILMVLMLIQVVWQVVSRYGLSHPSSFTDELSRFFLIWIGILGASYTMGQKLHLSINLLPERLNEKNRARLEIIINLIIILFSIGVLAIGGSRLVFITYSLGQTSAALKIPLWVIYSVLPLSGILTCYYCFSNILILSGKPDPNGKY